MMAWMMVGMDESSAWNSSDDGFMVYRWRGLMTLIPFPMRAHRRKTPRARAALRTACPLFLIQTETARHDVETAIIIIVRRDDGSSRDTWTGLA